jgi:hypothetical protein
MTMAARFASVLLSLSALCVLCGESLAELPHLRLDGRAEYPTARAVGPQDVLATMYHVLGIDYRHEFYDAAQRPIPVLNEGRPIQELIG